MRLKIYTACCLCCLLMLGTSCGEKKGVRVIKLAHILNPQHSVHKAMEYMAEKVNEKSGGKLQLEIYHSGQLGSESQCLELLQIGSLGITKVSAAVMEGFAPSYKVLGLPYIFKSKEHMFQVEDGSIGKRILRDGEKAWLRGLCFFDAGSRSFYTKNTPIDDPSDLSGLKIRVMKSITASKMVSSLGASPMPISFGELYTALQQGVVDGAENNPPSFYLTRHYEVCKYYTLNEHTAVPDVLIISTVIWNRLSDQEKEWLQEAANEAAVVQRGYWAESEAEALEAVKEAGVEVKVLSEEDKAVFSEKVASMYDDYKSDTLIYNLIEQIREME
ncbi:MAG: TRAP transporter substrate-binding protein [Bacteroidota bacterium]